MKKEYVLVTLTANYADEFDVDSLWLTTKEEYEKFIEKLKKNFKPNREHYFGTNEYVMFESIDDILEDLTVVDVSEEFYNTMLNLVGETFGMLNIEWLAE